MPRYEFTTGQVLTADQMNDLSDQTVMTFAGTAARGSAIPTPVEGMLTYLEDSDELQVYTNAWEAIAGGKILQVVSTNKTDLFTTTSGSFVDVTGFSATITPASTASKILVFVTAQIQNDSASGFWALNIVRGSTNIAQGTGGSSNNQTAWSAGVGSFFMSQLGFTVLDSPSTTSATTYKIQVNRTAAGTTQMGGNSSSSAFSSITLIEVAG